jgi:TRAP transporter 4TM/12TM fusion protein
MTAEDRPRPRPRVVVEALYLLVAVYFFVELFRYFLTGSGGPTLLAVTLVPITFVLFTLDALRKGEFYPRLAPAANYAIALAYAAIAVAVALYMHLEFIAIGTVRAGFWSTTDLVMGGLMAALVMEYARKRYFALFVLNLVLILYAAYGWLVPGMFHHPGLSWTRVVSAMSVEMTTGVFSQLPQLALTLIGSFILVLAVLRAFGCIDSILKGSSLIATRSPHALPQSAVLGSLGVAAISGSGAANAVTTGSATIPAMIGAGLPRENAAAVETAASLGGQLMPPIMGISAFLMADFLGVSYFEVVARGYAPALIYFASVSVGVYLVSLRYRARLQHVAAEPMAPADWANLAVVIAAVAALIVLMAVFHLPPMFAARDVFLAIGAILLASFLVTRWRGAEGGATRLRALRAPLVRFLDIFTSMTADLTLLLATLSIMVGAFVITGVPTKIGALLLAAAGVSVLAMALVAFVFGALLGTGLPPAPTYILTALVIAPPMIRAGIDPWVVHFFAFFLAVWGELTPPTSVVAAVTAKIADASFMGTLWRGVQLCISLFVLMAAVFARPELVLEPGLAQLGAMALVLVATVGITFSLQARFAARRKIDLAARAALAAAALVVLLHPALELALPACGAVALLIAWWLLRRREDRASA